MSSQSRKLKRQKQQQLQNKFRPKTINPANLNPVPPTVNAQGTPQTLNQQASIEEITRNAYMGGLSKGMSSMALFAIDTLQVSLEGTKGVGQKLTTAINHAFHENLHRKELFDNFMSDEPKGEVFIVSKEEQKFIELLREVENVVYSKENNLTIEQLLSILNHTETTHEELTSIIDNLKGVK